LTFCAHQPTGGSRVETHQGDYLGALTRRQQIKHTAMTRLTQLEDGVGGIVSPHSGQHPGDIVVTHIVEQLVGLIRVEFFENVGFQLGVTVNAIENLAALPLVGVFEQVSDLRRFELAKTPTGATLKTALLVSDQRFE
jgi:hypothetical protein